MRSMWWRSAARTALAALIVLGLAMPARGDNNPNGMAFRAVGRFKGKAEISAGANQGEDPRRPTASFSGAFGVGAGEPHRVPPLSFPGPSNPLPNPRRLWI